MSDLFDEFFGDKQDDRKICHMIAAMEMLDEFAKKRHRCCGYINQRRIRKSIH